MGYALLVWFAVVASAWIAAVWWLPVDPDYTSGELLDHLARWLATGVLYPALDGGPPWRVLNYPTLTLLVARGFAGLGVPELLAGRIMNLGGLLALIGMATWWARARGARGAVLAGTIGLLGVSFPVLYAAGQFHIELWASAGTVAGFALLDRAPGRRAALLGGALLALACFAKQTQVVPAFVALAWVWTHRRASARRATVGFAMAGLLGAGVTTLAFGAEAWRHMIVYTVGTYSLPYLGLQLLSHVAPWAILIGFVAWSVRRDPRAAGDALAWLWLGALVWSLSAARVGAGYTYFLDLHVATALWAGPRLFGERRLVPASALRVALTAQVVLAAAGAAILLGRHVSEGRALAEALPSICEAMPAEGLVLAEESGLVRACGREPLLHPFIMTSLDARGLWSASALEAAVARGDYTAAVLPFDPRQTVGGAQVERWSAEMLEAFGSADVVEPLGAGRWVVRWSPTEPRP